MPLLTQPTLKQAPSSGGTAFYGGVFGDGSDGTAVLDGTATVPWATKSGATYNMTRDAHTTGLTVAAGVTLNPSGWKILCQGAVSNAGTISIDGNAGTALGVGGGATGNGSLAGGAAGSVGNTAAGAAGASGFSARIGVGGSGAGGAGASGAGGSQGFAAITSGAPLRIPAGPLSSALGYNGGNVVTFGGAPSGAGGGGDGTNKGGGGGGGGGALVIFAKQVVNTGTLSARGGAGGTPATGNCGGGGGGGGGVVLLYTLTAASGLPTAAAACTGGVAGVGVGTGASGVSGGNGTITNVLLA